MVTFRGKDLNYPDFSKILIEKNFEEKKEDYFFQYSPLFKMCQKQPKSVLLKRFEFQSI